MDLLKDLQHLFSDLAKNASKLSNIGSTQANENFNKIVACKNPKALYYSGSESTSFRVAAAVAHKNIGHLTIGKVYQMLHRIITIVYIIITASYKIRNVCM